MKLSNVVKFRVGLNPTRIKGRVDPSSIYAVSNTEEDLKRATDFQSNSPDKANPYLLKEGDLVISVIKEKAAIVSRQNSGKIFNSNFIKADFNPEVIDPWYLCYFLNESETVKKAKNLRTGLTGLGYLHINPELLNSIELTLPPTERQKTIGKAYQNLCRYEYALEKQRDALKTLIVGLIRQQEKKGK